MTYMIKKNKAKLTPLICDNYLDGEDGNDTLIADLNNNELFGGAGDDTLSASGGNNYLDGGDGANTLIADGGGNTLIGGSGNDNLSAAGGNNYLDGGDGNDTLVTDGDNNTLIGGAGNDVLSALGTNNTLEGGAGDDWYGVNKNFGVVHIIDPDWGNGIRFNFSYSDSGVKLGIGSLMLSFANGDVLHIDNFDPSDPLNTCSIKTFQFTDRTLSLQEILDLGMDLSGTPQDDFIQGSGINDRINALAGNDIANSGAANDTSYIKSYERRAA